MKKFTVLAFLGGLMVLDLFAIQITPTYQIFTVKAGDKVEGRCTVSNNEEENLTISLSSKDWFILPGNEKYKAENWLSFKEKNFPLKKGESKEIQFFISPPKGAKGELIGMMSVGLAGATPSNVNKVMSVAMYAAIKGTEVLKGNVRAIMVTPSTQTLTVSILLANEGNVHIRPLGFFEVKDDKGEIVANIFLEQGPPVYPKKEGVFTGQVKDLHLKPGIYKCLISITDIDRKVDVLKTSRKFEILENYSVELK